MSKVKQDFISVISVKNEKKKPVCYHTMYRFL